MYTQVLQENEGVDMPGLELEKGDKSVGKVQERVLSVTSSHVRTNFNIQSVLVLTTYRCVCVCVCVCGERNRKRVVEREPTGLYIAGSTNCVSHDWVLII